MGLLGVGVLRSHGGDCCAKNSKKARPALPLPLFHYALHLTFAFAVLDSVALVMLGLAFGKGDFAFDEAIFPVQVQRNQTPSTKS